MTIEHQWEKRHGMLPVYNVPGALLPEATALKDAWKDKLVIIWGNGPTVTDALMHREASWFKEAKHIGTNAAALISGIKFDAYCIGDQRFLQKPEKLEIAKTAPGVRIYQSVLRPLLPGVQASFVKTIGREGVCSDLTKGIYHGYAVTWFALQVALWTGARSILLAGCPHDYSGPQPRFYPEKIPSDVDNTFPWIIHNYRNLMPILTNLDIRVRHHWTVETVRSRCTINSSLDSDKKVAINHPVREAQAIQCPSPATIEAIRRKL